MNLANQLKILKACDPGIRGRVEALMSAGFDTCDSGDGVSKPLLEGVLRFPHVVVKTSPAGMRAVADRVLVTLRAKGYADGLHVEATYDPADRSATVMAGWPL